MTEKQMTWDEVVAQMVVYIKERDALRAKLSAIEAQEPVAQVIRRPNGNITMTTMDDGPFDMSRFVGAKFYLAAPVAPAQPARDLPDFDDAEVPDSAPWAKAPAKPVNELVEALESIKQSSFNARFVAARALNAFANAKAAQPLTKEQVEDIEYWRNKYKALDKLYDELEKEKDAIEQNLRDRT